ncbi:protein serine/threonine kinase [Pseudohyphozyma bogoriensis]|nr:protein serine/threonine kinase [Pseudohyphozyma bogoriensis]
MKHPLVNSSQVHSAQATDASTGESVTLKYQELGVSGHGSFGVVVKAKLVAGGAGIVALKRTKQDKRFKNRELQIMQKIHHPNIVRLLYFYYQSTPSADEVFLNLVNYTKKRQNFPEILVKLYMHQLLRALSYLHSIGICHRDVKPHNILTDPDRGVMTLIDFGSAKVLKAGEPNVSYTCSRYYRAPELIFGSTKYTHTIDLWSTGCILGELLQGQVFFPGNSGIDQLVEIIKVLGQTPTRGQIGSMNPSYSSHTFPQIKPVTMSKLLPRASEHALDLLSKLLTFDPNERMSACEAMTHPFFDELRIPSTIQPNGKPLPPELFNFTPHELSVRPDLIRKLVPPHAEQRLYDEHGVDLSNFKPIDLKPLRVVIE